METPMDGPADSRFERVADGPSGAPSDAALPDPQRRLSREAWAALAYFAAYLAYLFWNPESELAHWLTLVILPLLLIVMLRRGRDPAQILASFGLRRGNLKQGLSWAIGLGLLIGVFQLYQGRAAAEAWELVRTGRVLYMFPLAFVLMMLTAGFTEEFFFRGFLQTRLEALVGSRWLAIVPTTLLFGVYHLPYAYLNPNWPSAGDWGAAWQAAMTNGVLGGIFLGVLYAATRRNLIACIVLHALINSVLAMTLIQFASG